MTVGAATEKTLGELHKAIADRLRIHVDDVECDPRYIQMAIKFCADNKITVVPNKTNSTGKLDKALKRRRKRMFNNVTDLSEEVAKRMVNGE